LSRAYPLRGEPSPTSQYLNSDVVDFAFVRGLAIIIDRATKTLFLTHPTLFGISGERGGGEDGGFSHRVLSDLTQVTKQWNGINPLAALLSAPRSNA
jgi:hypothetical protein